MADDIRTRLSEALKAAEELANEGAHTWVDGSTGVWKAQPDGYHSDLIIDDGNGEIVVYDEGRPTSAQALHIARWSPSTVLRLVERDRQLQAERDEAEQILNTRLASFDEGTGSAATVMDAGAQLAVLDRQVERAAAFWLGTQEADR